jgi:hypothetical protein
VYAGVKTSNFRLITVKCHGLLLVGFVYVDYGEVSRFTPWYENTESVTAQLQKNQKHIHTM